MGSLDLPFEKIEAPVKSDTLGRAIVIRRGSNELYFYRVGTKPKLIRMFKVATGRSEYPTPLGKFEVINKQANPWWYPPAGSDWAKDAEPIPPGSSNPLGTRWMGISSPYVGIHGTPNAASIGYSASHGCIQDADPAGRVALQPGRARNARLHRRSMTGRAKTVGQVIAVTAVVGLLVLLGWKLAFGNGGGASAELADGGNPVAPDFTLPRIDAEGGDLTFSSLKGKAVVVNFWASWCIPCKDEAPELQKTYEKYRDQGLVVLGVDAKDFRQDGKRFIKRFGLTYPVVDDGRGSTLGKWGVRGFPETFFVDREGRIVGEVIEGGIDLERNRERYAEGIRLALGDSK